MELEGLDRTRRYNPPARPKGVRDFTLVLERSPMPKWVRAEIEKNRKRAKREAFWGGMFRLLVWSGIALLVMSGIGLYIGALIRSVREHGGLG